MSEPQIYDIMWPIHDYNFRFLHDKYEDGTLYRVHGTVPTEHGFVKAEVRYYSGGAHTTLEFIHGGRRHVRKIIREHQPRYLITLAKRFAAGIVAREKTDD